MGDQRLQSNRSGPQSLGRDLDLKVSTDLLSSVKDRTRRTDMIIINLAADSIRKAKACRLIACPIVTVLIIAAMATPAFADSLKDKLVGTWIYVSSTAKRADGSSVPRPQLQGAVTYTADGHFHFITVPVDLPKIVSGDRLKPTPEEAKAVATGVIAYTGTYTLDESTKTVHPTVVTSTFPNMVASDQSRIITSVTADELRLTNPGGSGGLILELVFKRAK